jgi:hypothetical protein
VRLGAKRASPHTQTLELKMSKKLISLVVFLLSSCSSNSTLDFRIKAIPKNNVDSVVARKIVLAWAFQHHYQGGGWELEVHRRTEEDKVSCYKDEYYKKLLGEFCGADYMVASIYDKGYSSYNVIEECQDQNCKYRFSTVNQGIEE